MKLLLLGLGNPGEKFSDTRHNIGHNFVDYIANRYNAPFHNSDGFSISKLRLSSTDTMLLKSLNFMNLNGSGLTNLLNKHLLSADTFMLVHDEVNLPFGRAKLSQNKSAGGHNGVRSVIENLGYSPLRLRIGVDSPALTVSTLSKYVLSKFSNDEQDALIYLFPKLLHSLRLLITRGISFASNYTNRYPIPDPSC